MITAAEISQTITPHLTSLSEVRQLLEGAGRAWRQQGDASLLLPALDGLLGALEDIRLHAATLQDARHRFILQYVGMEAEVLLESSLGRHMGTLASVGLCFAFDHFGVPFNFVVWMLIDLAVVAVIIRPAMTAADCIVIALFIPAWCFYLLPAETRFAGSFAVVVAQLVLTFPVEALRGALVRLWARRGDDHFDRMAVA